jgi:hypothetical protein
MRYKISGKDSDEAELRLEDHGDEVVLKAAISGRQWNLIVFHSDGVGNVTLISGLESSGLPVDEEGRLKFQ